MKRHICLLLIVFGACGVECIPPPHPAVLNVRYAEELLPAYLRSPTLRNPRLQEILPLTSLLHNGEKPVYERDTDKIPRKEIYNILTHAGFIGRMRYLQQPLHKNPLFSAHAHIASYDSPFQYNPELLQYL